MSPFQGVVNGIDPFTQGQFNHPSRIHNPFWIHRGKPLC